MLFLFCLFLCCFITRLTCKCEARCCYKPESHFSTILFANNLARSSSVIQLGCFVAWPDGKGTGHYLSTLFSVSVCVQTQSVRWDGAFRNKAYSSWQHGSCNWRHGGRRNLPKGLFLTGGGAFCSDVLGTWPRSGQFQFFFFHAKAFEICIWLDPVAELLYLYGCAVYDLDIEIQFEGVGIPSHCELVLRRNPCGEDTV